MLNQVLLHQSIIGLESKTAMELLESTRTLWWDAQAAAQSGRPDLTIYARINSQERLTRCIVAVEPASCPSLTRGKYAYDFCDTGR